MRRLLFAGLLMLAALPAAAQTYPARQVRFIVPFPAGGTTDLLARLVGQKLSENLGQQFVIDNRAGAGATVGSDLAAKAPPDGYTIVMSNIASQGIGPSLYKTIPYDAVKDFAHIALIGTLPNVYLVHPSFPAKTVQEFIALAKAKPGSISFASAGNGTSTHLTGELLKLAAGIDLVHVPYRGAGPAMNDLIANQIPTFVDNLPTAAAQIRAGTVRALAITATTRSPSFPDIPTFAESGLPGFAATSWFGVSAPAGTPREIVDKLNAEIRRVTLSTPEINKRLQEELGVDPSRFTADEFTAFVADEIRKWAGVVKESGAKVD